MGRVDATLWPADAHAFSTSNPADQDNGPDECKIRVDSPRYRWCHYGWDDIIFTHLSARLPARLIPLNPYICYED